MYKPATTYRLLPSSVCLVQSATSVPLVLLKNGCDCVQVWLQFYVATNELHAGGLHSAILYNEASLLAGYSSTSCLVLSFSVVALCTETIPEFVLILDLVVKSVSVKRISGLGRRTSLYIGISKQRYGRIVHAAVRPFDGHANPTLILLVE